MNVGQRGINSKDLGAGRLILDLFHDVALYFWESVIVERIDDLRNAADRFFFPKYVPLYIYQSINESRLFHHKDIDIK